MKQKRPALKVVLGQPSWRIASPRVEAFITQLGGHLGPITFDRQRKKIMPMAVAPWASEKIDPATPAILRVLRGDLFCLPFGGNEASFRGERHPAHGETANARWTFESLDKEGDAARLHLSLRPRIRPGRVDKFIRLAADHDAVYQRHVISGMSGPMPLGHHAMLKFPDETGSGIISTSATLGGQVFVEPVERPENRGYSILKPGAEFDSLESVPTIFGQMTDVSRYPARRGYEDIVMLTADDSLPFAWTAVTFPKQRYVWFALKDPRVLHQTVLWFSNGGRHFAPWNGRHVNVMGLEEVTAYFHYGLAESAKANPLSRRGLPTVVRLDPREPTVVNYIMAAVPIPPRFNRVARIERSNDGVNLIADGGAAVHTRLDVNFLNRSEQP